MAPALTRRIKIVLVLVLEKRGWFGELLEYRALSELHPVLGLAVLKGRKMFAMDLSFAMSVHLRKTDLPPLRGGRVFKTTPGVKDDMRTTSSTRC